MQNLHLESAVVGFSSHKPLFSFCTESGSVYICNSSTRLVENEVIIPLISDQLEHICWSNDGDFVFVSTGSALYFFRPQQKSKIESIDLSPRKIDAIFPHVDGFSVILLFSDNSFCNVKPNSGASPSIIGPLPENERIVSFVVHQKKVAAVVDGDSPQIRFLDPGTFDVQSTIDVEKHTASIVAAASTTIGIVVVRADGFWTRYNEQSIASGTAAAPLFVDTFGPYLASSCGDSVRIFDLKFDAELQRIDVDAQQALIFQNTIVSFFDKEVHFRDWKGLNSTSTRDLIYSQLENKSRKSLQCDEIKIEFKGIQGENSQVVSTEVIQSKADFKFKSVSSVIDSIMDNKFVPVTLRQKVIKQLEDEKYNDVRDLALFRLSTTTSYKDVKKALKEGNILNVVMMLKKIEPLNGKQAASFIKLALKDVKKNEIALAHFLTQPLNEKAAVDAAKILNADEVDMLLTFLSRLMASRRYWREFEASLSVIDAINRWGSILIKSNITVLALQHKTAGLIALQNELQHETERIRAAGTCWSIIETITEEKMDAIPPSFMYLVEKINIPE